MSNRRRIRPARNDLAVRAQSDDQADEDSGVCDCPSCMAEDAAPVLFDMLIGGEDPPGDPITAECGMAMLLTMGEAAGVDHDEWHDVVLADLTGAGTTQAAGMTAALASLSEGKARADALTAIAKGPSLPEWAKELVEPLTAVRCLRLEDRDGDVWALAAEFSRGAGRHAFVLLTEPDECCAAIDLAVCGPDELPIWLNSVKKTASDQDYRLEEIALDQADFRAEAEAAIGERREHDAYDLIGEDDYVDDYTAHGEDDVPDVGAFTGPDPTDGKLELDLEIDDELDDIAGELPDDVSYYTLLPVFQARLRLLTGRVMRLRVDIKGSKPPIWRRLEVPTDLTLARLHDVLQTSFGWTDDHLHVFETDVGRFGRPGGSLGFTSDARVTLDWVVARAGNKISYTYDFGDDWHHVIKVEQVMLREPAITYPRCTGGRRAAPPEDCGGIWAYQWLLEVLADPAHEEHEERLDWLGLERASQFDPEAFDPDRVSKALSARFG